MSNFQRKLNLQTMSDANLASAPWLDDMLRHWYPAGHPALIVSSDGAEGSKKSSGERPSSLRLAIRNGYINFYCGGQSVAKIAFGKTLTARTHRKYLPDDPTNHNDYPRLTAAHSDIPAIIARTFGYQGVEKLFVDAVCGKNEMVIDMEMALPSQPVSDGALTVPRVAPRMDLVALEPVGPGWQVVFWEAKLPDDKRMRTRGKTPEVITQLETYKTWFASPTASEAVLSAYRDTCKLLVEIHERAGQLGVEVLPLGSAVKSIARTPSLLIGIDPQVRLLIDMRKADLHFDAQHLPKFEGHKIPVHCVRSEGDLILPVMPAAA